MKHVSNSYYGSLNYIKLFEKSIRLPIQRDEIFSNLYNAFTNEKY